MKFLGAVHVNTSYDIKHGDCSGADLKKSAP